MSVSERFMTAMELPGDLSCKAPIITIIRTVAGTD